MLKMIVLVFFVLAGCVTPDTTEVSQSVCNTQVGNPDCPGSCVPISWCLDEDLHDGTCCPHFKHPYLNPIHEINCGTNMEGQGECISRNKYFDGSVVQIECVTVITWYPTPDGGLLRGEQTDCHYY